MQHLYVMSDTHDDLEAVDTAVDFAESQGLKNSRIVHCGDLSLRPYSVNDLKDLKRTRDVPEFITAKRATNGFVLEEMKRILDDSGIPYTVQPGNYDGDLTPVFGDQNLHLGDIQIGEVKAVGYGGADANPPHIGLLEQIGEIIRFNHSELYGFLMKTKPTIAIIHNPPQGLCDDMYNGQNVGTPATTKYLVEEGGVKLVLSGHIHEAGPNANNPKGVFGIAQSISPKDGKVITVVNPGNLGRFELVNPETLDTHMEFPFGTFVRVDIEDDGTPVFLNQYTVEAQGRTVGEVREMRQIDLQ